MSALLSAPLDTMRMRVRNTRLGIQVAAENGKQISAEQSRNVGGFLVCTFFVSYIAPRREYISSLSSRLFLAQVLLTQRCVR